MDEPGALSSSQSLDCMTHTATHTHTIRTQARARIHTHTSTHGCTQFCRIFHPAAADLPSQVGAFAAALAIGPGCSFICSSDSGLAAATESWCAALPPRLCSHLCSRPLVLSSVLVGWPCVILCPSPSLAHNAGCNQSAQVRADVPVTVVRSTAALGPPRRQRKTPTNPHMLSQNHRTLLR